MGEKTINRYSVGSSAGIAFNSDPFPDIVEQPLSDWNDPASKPNDFLFDSQSLDYDANIPFSDPDRDTTIATNAELGHTDPAASSSLLESSCRVEGNGQINDVLRARDSPACKTEDLNLPLDFGTDSWWRKLFPPKKPASKPGLSPVPGGPNPQNVPMITPDIFKGFFNEIDEERRCPKEFPIRCCSGYVMGYQAGLQEGLQFRTIYFIGHDDCVPSTFLQDSAKSMYKLSLN